MRMRQETPTTAITDLIWPAQPAAQAMRSGGLVLLLINAQIVAFGLFPGGGLGRVAGVDIGFLAIAGLVGGLLLWANGGPRAKTRRLRVDREARVLERSYQALSGAWVADITLSLADITGLSILESGSDDQVSSFSIWVTVQNGDTSSLWPVNLSTREAAEEALQTLQSAMAGSA